MKKNRNVRYFLREGFRNIGTNGLMSVASVAVLMSCLVMIGSAVMIFLNVDSLLQKIEAQNVIMVFLEKEASDEVVSNVGKQLEALDNVENVEFVSRAAAFDTVVESLGENASILNGVDNSFLPDGYKVTVSDMQFFSQTVAAIGELNYIMSIQENSDLASRLENIRTAVSYVSLGIIILLFIVALFIIANTVRITMFTRRLEISIMKAVGATNWFIRWPFLIEGITIGLIAAVLAIGVLYLIYFLAGDALLTIFGILNSGLVPFKDYALYIFAAFAGVSIVTGGLGSIFSIGRYLKEQGSVILDDNN